MSDEPDFSLHPDPAVASAAAHELFERTATTLRLLLPASADIRHIGSTSIPGCLTKGDLDVVVRVLAADFPAADAALATRYPRNTGSSRTDAFSAFEDPESSPHLGIQLAAIDGPYDDFHRFADVLRRDAALVARYNALKIKFDGRPMAEYRTAKDAFIAEVLAAEKA